MSITVRDFDNDTHLDIAVVNAFSSNIIILFGRSNSIFMKENTITTDNGSRPRSFVIANFNNDGYMDVGVANSGNDSVGIFLGYGNFSFASEKTFSTGPYSSPYSIVAGDLDNDIRLDIVVANYGSNSITIFLGFNNDSFANQVTYLTGLSPLFVAVDDFNSDTFLDIFVVNYYSNSVSVFGGHGDGTFSNMIPISMDYGSHPFFLVVGDLNNDRKLDFIVENNGTDILSVYLQTC